MALTSQTLFDIVGQTQSISFFEGVTQVDQITFTSNSFTFSAISSFNLNKGDCLLYFQYLNAYFNALLINFSGVSINENFILPLCTYDLTISNVGVKKVIFTENSQGTNVYTITYVPIAASTSYAARANPVTISFQEFYLMISQMSVFSNQVTLN